MSTLSAPAADPIVSDFRLSFIWVEPMFGVVTGDAKPMGSYEFLSSKFTYVSTFDQVLKGSGPAGLEVPWQRRKKQFFWKYFLGSAGLDQASGRQAWSRFVPLKSTLPFTASNARLKSVSIEGFYYPHAFSLMISCRFLGKLPVTDAANLAYAIKQGSEKFSVQQNNVPTPSPLDVDSLAENVLTYMRESALGKTAKPGRTKDVFSVFTVVTAQPSTNFEFGGPVHRALQTVTDWPPDPPTAKLLPESDISVRIKKTTAEGSILVGRPRARAIWFPGLFSAKDLKKPTLGCYHRNQSFSAMQVESLCVFMRCALDLTDSGIPFANLKAALRVSAADVAARLSELYLADSQSPKTYRSSSTKFQIEQNDIKRFKKLLLAVDPGSEILSPPKSPAGPAAPSPTTPPAAGPAPNTPKA
ncbi:MAG TPA: hypothetical protein VN881_02280 [Candidatus Acidoferrales bacterium]|nr:hypothetical protein [Candidatus Acidoferrales bacterium]